MCKNFPSPNPIYKCWHQTIMIQLDKSCFIREWRVSLDLAHCGPTAVNIYWEFLRPVTVTQQLKRKKKTLRVDKDKHQLFRERMCFEELPQWQSVPVPRWQVNNFQCYAKGQPNVKTGHASAYTTLSATFFKATVKEKSSLELPGNSQCGTTDIQLR